MKKISLILALCLVLTVFAGVWNFNKPDENGGNDAEGSHEVSKAEANDILSLGLRAGINVIDDKYLDIKMGDSVFSEEGLVENGVLTYNAGKRETNRIDKESIVDINEEYFGSFSLGVSASASDKIGMFSSGMESKFAVSSSSSSDSHTYKYYCYSSHLIGKTGVALKNPADYLSYSKILSKGFLNAAEMTDNGDMSIDEFFNLYGTHVVTRALYGGKVEISCTVTSSNVISTQDVSTLFTNSVNASVNAGIVSGSGQTNVAAAENFEKTMEEKGYTSILKFNGIGGTNFAVSSFKDFLNSYPNWVNEFNSENAKKSIVEIENNGLSAVWNYLPEKYSALKARMKQMFIEKLENSSSSFYKKYFVEIGNSKIGPMALTSVNGKEEIKVIDGRDDNTFAYNGANSIANGDYCVIPLKDLDLKGIRYNDKNLRITITFTMWEKDDGYQELFLYNKDVTASMLDKKNSTEGLVTDKKILAYNAKMEHCSGKQSSERLNYKAVAVIKARDVLDDGAHSEIWLGYDANGTNDDTWYIKNIKVTVEMEESSGLLNNLITYQQIS